jgi:hypothetical protein
VEQLDAAPRRRAGRRGRAQGRAKRRDPDPRQLGLLQTLIEHDLVDEYRLWTFPVLLGSGKRLFDAGTIPAGLELIDSTTSSTGVVIDRYRRAGDIRYGTFEVDERGGV